MKQKGALQRLTKALTPSQKLLFRFFFFFFCFNFHFWTSLDILWTLTAGGLMHCSLLLSALTNEAALLLQSLSQQSPSCLKSTPGKLCCNCLVGHVASKGSPSGLIRRDLVLHFPLYLSHLGLHPSSVCAVITSLGKTVPLPNCLHSQEIVSNSQLNLISPSSLDPPQLNLHSPSPSAYMKWLYGVICSYFSRPNKQNNFLEFMWLTTIVLNSFSLGWFEFLSAVFQTMSKSEVCSAPKCIELIN